MKDVSIEEFKYLVNNYMLIIRGYNFFKRKVCSDSNINLLYSMYLQNTMYSQSVSFHSNERYGPFEALFYEEFNGELIGGQNYLCVDVAGCNMVLKMGVSQDAYMRGFSIKEVGSDNIVYSVRKVGGINVVDGEIENDSEHPFVYSLIPTIGLSDILVLKPIDVKYVLKNRHSTLGDIVDSIISSVYKC